MELGAFYIQCLHSTTDSVLSSKMWLFLSLGLPLDVGAYMINPPLQKVTDFVIIVIVAALLFWLWKREIGRGESQLHSLWRTPFRWVLGAKTSLCMVTCMIYQFCHYLTPQDMILTEAEGMVWWYIGMLPETKGNKSFIGRLSKMCSKNGLFVLQCPGIQT